MRKYRVREGSFLDILIAFLPFIAVIILGSIGTALTGTF